MCSDKFRKRYFNLGNSKEKLHCTVLFSAPLIIQRHQTEQYNVSINLHVREYEHVLLNSMYALEKKGFSTQNGTNEQTSFKTQSTNTVH